MLLGAERESIVRFGRKLVSSSLTTGSGGNLSVYNRAERLVAIKPSGVDYLDLEPADVVVMTMAGQVVEGRLEPSSEFNFHLGLMRARPEVNAVVHTHSVYATTLACLGWELPAVHYLVGFSGNKVPVAPYATFGTQELADNIVNAIGSYNACLMANHGLVAVANNLATAFAVAEEIELVARIYYQARSIGAPVILPDAEMAKVCEKFKTYGQKK
jgi:L-fuculose-phosphate aldolase